MLVDKIIATEAGTYVLPGCSFFTLGACTDVVDLIFVKANSKINTAKSVSDGFEHNISDSAPYQAVKVVIRTPGVYEYGLTLEGEGKLHGGDSIVTIDNDSDNPVPVTIPVDNPLSVNVENAIETSTLKVQESHEPRLSYISHTSHSYSVASGTSIPVNSINLLMKNSTSNNKIVFGDTIVIDFYTLSILPEKDDFLIKFGNESYICLCVIGDQEYPMGINVQNYGVILNRENLAKKMSVIRGISPTNNDVKYGWYTMTLKIDDIVIDNSMIIAPSTSVGLRLFFGPFLNNSNVDYLRLNGDSGTNSMSWMLRINTIISYHIISGASGASGSSELDNTPIIDQEKKIVTLGNTGLWRDANTDELEQSSEGG